MQEVSLIFWISTGEMSSKQNIIEREVNHNRCTAYKEVSKNILSGQGVIHDFTRAPCCCPFANIYLVSVKDFFIHCIE